MTTCQQNTKTETCPAPSRRTSAGLHTSARGLCKTDLDSLAMASWASGTLGWWYESGCLSRTTDEACRLLAGGLL